MEVKMMKCWKCESMNKYLKSADYIIYCLHCGKFYYKGKEYTRGDFKRLLKENKI